MTIVYYILITTICLYTYYLIGKISIAFYCKRNDKDPGTGFLVIGPPWLIWNFIGFIFTYPHNFIKRKVMIICYKIIKHPGIIHKGKLYKVKDKVMEINGIDDYDNIKSPILLTYPDLNSNFWKRIFIDEFNEENLISKEEFEWEQIK